MIFIPVPALHIRPALRFAALVVRPVLTGWQTMLRRPFDAGRLSIFVPNHDLDSVQGTVDIT